MGFGLAAEALHGGVIEPVSCLDFGLGGAVDVKQVLCLAWVLAEHRYLVAAGFSAVAEAIDLTVNEHHDGAEGEEDAVWMNGDHGGAGLGVAGAVAAEDGEAGEGDRVDRKTRAPSRECCPACSRPIKRRPSADWAPNSCSLATTPDALFA